MKMIGLFSLLALLAFSTTGCFEILEEVNLHADGTGDLKFTINLSESKTTLASYLELGEFQGQKVPTVAEMQAELTKVRSTLERIEGLSNVEVISNFTDFVFEVRTAFSNVQALNTAINAVADAFNDTPFQTLELDNFDYTGQAFRRYFNYPVTLLDFEDMPGMYQYVLDSGKLTSVYHFDRDVRAVTNDNAVISPSHRSVMLQTSVGSMIRGESTIANSVILHPK